MTCCVAINAKEGDCWIVLSLMSHKFHINYLSQFTNLTHSSKKNETDSDNRAHSVIEENEIDSDNRAHSVIKGIMEKSVLTELHSVSKE